MDVFPPHQQAQVRVQLAMTLAGVLSQRLALRADPGTARQGRCGSGRVAACEVMIGTPAVRNLIREAKTPQMVNVIQTGRGYAGKSAEPRQRSGRLEVIARRVICESS